MSIPEVHVRSKVDRACIVEHDFIIVDLQAFIALMEIYQHLNIFPLHYKCLCTYIDLAFSKSASLSSLSLPVFATPPVTFALMISFA
jgi:hypothetical protein